MKSIFLYFLMLIILACSNKEHGSDKNEVDDEKGKLDFTVIDSGIYYDELDGGKFQIIKLANSDLDTIDADFGINILSDDSKIFLKVSKTAGNENNDTRDSIYGSIENYTLLTDSSRTILNSIIPYFSDYFSSPALINDDLYYWGMELKDPASSLYNIYAIRYNLVTKVISKRFIFKDEIATDFRGYFPTPYQENNSIIFLNDSTRKLVFNKDFKQLK